MTIDMYVYMDGLYNVLKAVENWEKRKKAVFSIAQAKFT